ncbi:hypothetical protein [Parvularcula marina]|uniref:hypothetical protein n=1 Tax=Parvularcula marina TaxID=2292771 RepID=UPI0035173650
MRGDLAGHLQLFDEWYSQASRTERRLMRAAMMQLRIAGTTQHIWRSFISTYQAFESVTNLGQSAGWRLLQGRVPHAYKPSYVCQSVGIPVPKRARRRHYGSKPVSTFAEIRNGISHEASFGNFVELEGGDGEVLDASRDLKGIVSKSILKLVGSKSKMVTSSVTSRQKQGLDMPEEQIKYTKVQRL